MKIARHDLYLVAGLGMIVGSFFAAAKAIGGIVAVVFFITTTDFPEADPNIAEYLGNSLKTSHLSEAMHGIGSFCVLFFGGRWMLRGPKLLDRWIDGDEQAGEKVSGSPEAADADKPEL